MAINTTTLNAKILALAKSIKDRAKRKPATAEVADNTPLLNGKTPAVIAALLTDPLAAHVKATDPHDDDPNAVGTYSQTQVDQILSTLIPIGTFPLSRFGALSYLPIGVSGNFEGSTTLKDTPGTATNYREQYSMQLENDGTLVWLRNGTDGVSSGVYYGYIRNAVNGLQPINTVLTVTRYSPPWLAAGQTVAYLYQGGDGLLAGRLRDSNGSLGKCFILITNGTLDSVGHTRVVFLDAGTWEDILNTSECILAASQVLILRNPQVSLQGTEGHDLPLDMALYSIALSDFAAGTNTVTPSGVGSIVSTGFGGAVNQLDSVIRMANKWQSQNDGDSALVYHSNPADGWFGSNIVESEGHGRMMTSSILSDDKTAIRVLVFHDSLFQQGNLLDLPIEYSFTYSLNTRAAYLDSGLSKIVLTRDANNNLLATSGQIISGSNRYRFNNEIGFDASTRLYVSESGLMFTSRIQHVANDNDGITRAPVSGFTSRFAALRAPIRAASYQSFSIMPMFGSAWGDSFDAPRLLPDNQVVTLTRNNDGLRFARGRYAPSGSQAQPNTTLGSITGGAIGGFTAQVDRATVPADDDFKLFLNEVTDSGVSARGSVLNEFLRTSSFVTMTSTMAKVGSVSLTPEQLQSLRSDALARAGTTQVKNATAEVVIPQNEAMFPYMLVSYVTHDFRAGVVMARLWLSARSGAIGSAAVDSIVRDMVLAENLTENSIQYHPTDSRRAGNHFIYETSDGFMVVGNASTLYLGFNYARYLSYRFFVNKADLSCEGASGGLYPWGVPYERYGAFPGKGVGVFSPLDYATKSMFRSLAQSKGQFLNWGASEQSRFALVSQNVAQGFVVYFTEQTAILIAGMILRMPIRTVDLSSIKSNPANTTFYVYAVYSNGTVNYQISTTPLEESYTVMFIGTIVTNSTNIINLTIKAVTRLDTYRLNDAACGSSIPVSAGTPNAASRLEWT